MNIKVSNWVIIVMLVAIGVLIVAIYKGCKKIKTDQAYIETLIGLTDSFSVISQRAVNGWAESKQKYKDSLEFERGQRLLAENQKERTEDDLNNALNENETLLKKYKNQKYTDTSTILAPKEFIDDCKDCFERLRITDGLTLKYKKEVDVWALKFKKETDLISNRLMQVERERDDYHFQVDSLTLIQKKSINSIKPKGRLYLSWGVLWNGWPSAAGAGLMYQTPRNMIFGVMGYYGAGKTTIGTTINFPLSLRKSK